MSDLERAKALLERPGCTFAAVRGEQERTSGIRGVKPLLDQLEEGLDGWSCADKAVGKAPAMLYVLLGVKEVYTHVITKDAENVLSDAGIKYTYDVETDKIMNRDGTDICPMEKAVAGLDAPEEALSAVRAKLKEI